MAESTLIAAEALPSPVPSEPEALSGPAGPLAMYTAQNTDARGAESLGQKASVQSAVALVHSVNAAASAHEMRVLFERLQQGYDVFALDLPGFGRSPRLPIRYDIPLMTDAVHRFLQAVRQKTKGPVHVIGLSLASEFILRALARQPAEDLASTVTLITPTGLSKGTANLKRSGASREFAGMAWLFEGKPWSGLSFRLLTSKASIRYFYRRTFGGSEVPEDLVEYAFKSARVPGAEHAPLSFLTGRLFSGDVRLLYEQLKLPTCIIHGTKGDFKDFREVDSLRSMRPNFEVHAMDTGALCHIEQPETFEAYFRSFLEASGGPS